MGSENFQTGIDLIFRISKNGIDWTRCEMNKFLKHFVPFLMKMVEMGSENFKVRIDSFFRISKNRIDWTRCEMNKFLKHFG